MRLREATGASCSVRGAWGAPASEIGLRTRAAGAGAGSRSRLGAGSLRQGGPGLRRPSVTWDGPRTKETM